MGNFTTSYDGNEEAVKQKPKSATIELIRQYARVCTTIPTISLSLLIAN